MESDDVSKIAHAIASWKHSVAPHTVFLQADPLDQASKLSSALAVALAAENVPGAAIEAIESVFSTALALVRQLPNSGSKQLIKGQLDSHDSPRTAWAVPSYSSQPSDSLLATPPADSYNQCPFSSQHLPSQSTACPEPYSTATGQAGLCPSTEQEAGGQRIQPPDSLDSTGLGRFSDSEKYAIFDMFGGWEGLGAAVNEMYGRMRKDPLTERFFVGRPHQRLVKHMTTFLSSALLGRFMYSREALRRQHCTLMERQGLGPEHVDVMTKHLVDVLRQMGINEGTIQSAVTVLDQQKTVFEHREVPSPGVVGCEPALPAYRDAPAAEDPAAWSADSTSILHAMAAEVPHVRSLSSDRQGEEPAVDSQLLVCGEGPDVSSAAAAAAAIVGAAAGNQAAGVPADAATKHGASAHGRCPFASYFNKG